MTDIRVATADDPLDEIAASALTLDTAEAPALVARLRTPPEGRAWTALVTTGAGAGGITGVVFASLSVSDPATGHIDLLAVSPSAQGHGHGRALTRAAEDWLRAHGATQARFAGNPPCYAWPGIDVRATPAACLAESLGYERYHVAWNMTADLTGDLSAPAPEGVTIHATVRGERDQVVAFVREHWGDNWAWEAENATTCHHAARDDEILGFAAWGGRPGWFGPMGTAPAARGLGVGGVLLRRCLAARRATGQTTAQISWVGPIRFYSRAIGARAERVFWQYRRDL